MWAQRHDLRLTTIGLHTISVIVTARLAWERTAMSPHTPRIAAYAFIFLLCAYPQTSHTQQEKTPSKTNSQAQKSRQTITKSASAEFGFIETVLLPGFIDNESKWKDILIKEGFVQKEDLWDLEAADGEVRVQAFFTKDEERSFFLLFFPAGSTALSDATASWLYRTASSYSFEGGDQVELAFPEETVKVGQRTRTRSRTFLISLTSGRLSRSIVHISWQ